MDTYVCLLIHFYLFTCIRSLHTYVHNMHIRMYISVQLLQEFIAVWRWTIYQRWGVYSVVDATDSSGKVSRPSASQHSIMTKVHIRMYICLLATYTCTCCYIAGHYWWHSSLLIWQKDLWTYIVTFVGMCRHTPTHTRAYTQLIPSYKYSCTYKYLKDIRICNA